MRKNADCCDVLDNGGIHYELHTSNVVVILALEDFSDETHVNENSLLKIRACY